MSRKYSVGGWRKKTLARRDNAPQGPVMEVDLGDGCEFLGRRVDVQAWVKAGRMPSRLVEQVLLVHKGEATQIDESVLTARDTIASLKFTRDIVCASFVQPVLIADENAPLGEGEMYYSEAFADTPEWIDKIVNWQLQGAPGIPVQMANGEVVTLEELDTFRDDEPVPSVAATSADSEELRDTPQPVDWAS